MLLGSCTRTLLASFRELYEHASRELYGLNRKSCDFLAAFLTPSGLIDKLFPKAFTHTSRELYENTSRELYTHTSRKLSGAVRACF